MAIPIKNNVDVVLNKQPETPIKEKKTIMSAEMKETHTILRTLSLTPDHNTAFGVAEVDAYLNTFLSEGWRIIGTHYIGNAPEGWIFAWMLVR
jgi:hypothetical protein